MQTKKGNEKTNNRYKAKRSSKLFSNNGNMKNQNNIENKLSNNFATAEAAWIEKKQKLYKDTNNQPLWDFRKIQINPIDIDELFSFPTNKITSTKYGSYTFIFRILYEQLLRLPNLWFLIISLLEYIPSFQILSDHLYYYKHSSIYLLLSFIIISIIKNLYEDSRRSNIDYQINNRLCYIIDGSTSNLKVVKWMDLTVGSIIRLVENEQVPADIILLSCNNSDGSVYVETSLVNGETNLKKKYCVNETRNESSVYSVCNIRGRITCEKPNMNMESFNGSLKLDAHPRATSLSINNVVFKGSYIKNTDYVFGVIIYTGVDTKIMKNTLRNTYKSGYVNSELNTYTIITILFVFFCVFISTLCKWTDDSKYKHGTDVLLITVTNGLFEFIMKYIILYSNIIPISVLITIDLISIMQSILIENDNRISVFENETSEPLISDDSYDITDLKTRKSYNYFRKYTQFLNNFNLRNFSRSRNSSNNMETYSYNKKSFISTFDKLVKFKNQFNKKDSNHTNSKPPSNAICNRMPAEESYCIPENKYTNDYSFSKKSNNNTTSISNYNDDDIIHKQYGIENIQNKPSYSKKNNHIYKEHIREKEITQEISVMHDNQEDEYNNIQNKHDNFSTKDSESKITKSVSTNNKYAIKNEKTNIFKYLFPFLFNKKNSNSKMVNLKNDIKKYALSQKKSLKDNFYGWGICLNSNMHGDLGNVDFIFTDKTGTLTNNEMSFNICSIAGRVYGKPRRIKNRSRNKNKIYFSNQSNIYYNTKLENRDCITDQFEKRITLNEENTFNGITNDTIEKIKNNPEEIDADQTYISNTTKENIYKDNNMVKNKMNDDTKITNDKYFNTNLDIEDDEDEYKKFLMKNIQDHHGFNENNFDEYTKDSYKKNMSNYKSDCTSNINDRKKISYPYFDSSQSLEDSSIMSSDSSSETDTTSISDYYKYSSDTSFYEYQNSEINEGMDGDNIHLDYDKTKINKNDENDNSKNDQTDKLINKTYIFNKSYLNYLMEHRYPKPKNFRINMIPEMTKTRCEFNDKKIFIDLNSNTWRSYYIEEFFKCITLCHTIVPYIQFDYIRNKNLAHNSSRHSKVGSNHFERYNNEFKKNTYTDISKANNEINSHVSRENTYESKMRRVIRHKKKHSNNSLIFDNTKMFSYSINKAFLDGKRARLKASTNDYSTQNSLKNENKQNNMIKKESTFQMFVNKYFNKNKLENKPDKSQDNYNVVKENLKTKKKNKKGDETEDEESNKWNNYYNFTRNKSIMHTGKNYERDKTQKRHSTVSFKRISKEKMMSLSSYSDDKFVSVNCKNKSYNLSYQNSEVSSSHKKNETDLEDYPSNKIDNKSTGTYDDLDKTKDMNVTDNGGSEYNAYLDSIKYQSTSLDEECLIYTSSYLGYRLILRNKNTMCVEINGNFYNWTIIGINEFTNKRGRMSIVVKPEYMTKGSILYIKGSDASILSLLNLKHSKFFEKKKRKKIQYSNKYNKMNKYYSTEVGGRTNNSTKQYISDHSLKSEFYETENYQSGVESKIYKPSFQFDKNNEYGVKDNSEDKNLYMKKKKKNKFKERSRQLEKQLRKFSMKGLRTMVFAFRYLNEKETMEYKKMYDDACMSIYNKETKLEDVANHVEKDLTYLGITGIKDSLQKKVTNTMEMLNQSGVRIWMLTGDNVEYSLHIAFLCNFLNSHTKIFHAMLENTSYKKLKREGTALYELFQLEKEEKKPHEKICLLINGKNLQTFLNHNDLQTYFLNMACTSDAVIACRITAKQKAFIVRLIKNRLSPRPNTLAIGDGANDIAMIQEANIGISIMTSKSIISAGYSDYCIKNFCYLRKLLFIYGSKHLYSISIILYWNFFKNIILILPVFFYQAYASWSCVKIYPELLHTLISVFWVLIPIIYYMFLQHNLNYDILYNIPLFYALSRRKYNMSILKFLSWAFEAIFYSLIVFFFSYAALSENSHLNNGEVVTINTFGNICFLGCLLISIFRLFLEGSLWSPSILITCCGCFLFVFFPSILFICIAYLSNEYIREVFRQTFLWNPIYVLLFLWFTTCIICYMLITFTKSLFFPNIYNVVNHWLFEYYQEKYVKYKYSHFISGKSKFLSLKKIKNKLKKKFRRKQKMSNSAKCNFENEVNNNTSIEIKSEKSYKNNNSYVNINIFEANDKTNAPKNFNDQTLKKKHEYKFNNNIQLDEEQISNGRNIVLSTNSIHAMEFDEDSVNRNYENKKNKVNKIENHNLDVKHENIRPNDEKGNEMKNISIESQKNTDDLKEIPNKIYPFQLKNINQKKNIKKKINEVKYDETPKNKYSSYLNNSNTLHKDLDNLDTENDFYKYRKKSLISNNSINYNNDTTTSADYYYTDENTYDDSKSEEEINPNGKIDESLIIEMKNCLNPFKNTFLIDLLPQGKNFQINEEHVFFKNNERIENIPEPLDVNKKNYNIIQNKPQFYVNDSVSEFSYTSEETLSDTNNNNMNNNAKTNKKKQKNENTQQEIVKVSNLINRLTLAFKDMQLESGFQIHKKNKFYKTYIPWYRFIFVLLGIFFIYIWKLELLLSESWNIIENSSANIFILILSVLLELTLCVATFTTFFPRIFIENFNKIISAVVVLIIAHHVVSYSITHIDGVFQAVLFPLYTFVILRLSFVNAVLYNIIFLALFIIRFKGDNFLDVKGLVHYIPLFIGVDVFVGFVGYRLEYNQRKNFLLEYSVESSRRKQREILNTMLPPFVVDEMIYSELNEEGIPISLKAEDIETVTIIFCDIYEFQNIVATIEPTRLVEMLDRLFLCFDKCTEHFNCTKIETVFETYLAACGLVKKCSDDNKGNKAKEDAHDSIDFALSILQVSSHIKYETNKFMIKNAKSLETNQLDENDEDIEKDNALERRPTRIRVKIGINSGRIIAGVVGSKKPQYALFGDTVNTASRMKTTGKPDYIHISEATYDLIKDDKTLIYEKKETEVKGKGTMATYLLTSVIGLNYPFTDEHVDRKNNFLSDFYLDHTDVNDTANYEQTQNIFDYYSNKVTKNQSNNQNENNNKYNLNETINSEENNYIDPEDPNQDYVNLKDLSLNKLPNEYIRDVNTNYYDIIKLRNLKISTAIGHQLKQKDLLSMALLNSGFNNDSSGSVNKYFENNNDTDEIKDIDNILRKQSINDSLYYLNDSIIRKDQEYINSLSKKYNQNNNTLSNSNNMLRQFNRQSINSYVLSAEKEIEDTHEEDYQNIQLCARRCNNCHESYCSPNNCINDDHVNHVAYHQMLSNIRRNYLKHMIKDDKKDPEKHKKIQKYNIFNLSCIFSCIPKLFTWIKQKNTLTHKKNYTNNSAYEKDDRKLYQNKSTNFISLNREWIFLKFSDKNLEAKYKAHFYSNKSNINSIEQALIIFLVTFVIQTLISSIVPIMFVDHQRATQTLKVNYFAYWSVRSVYTYIGFMVWLLFHYRTRSEVSSLLNIKWMIFFLNLLFISAACAFSIAYLWTNSETDNSTSQTIWMTHDTVELFFYLVILHHNTGMLFQTCILVDLLFITMSLTFISTSVVKTITTDSTVLLIPWYIIFNLISTYCKESIDRRTFYANESAKKTERRATDLLNDMLPKHVLEEFQQDKLKLAYTHDRLTFLFADICGFTSWANGVDASEVLTLLQKLFARFDNDSTKYGLYKLCTIGDAYVAISEPVTEDNNDYDPVDGTERVLEMAYSMIRIIKEIREKLCIPNLNMRIGLHYGSCVGGVIGSGRLRYDLWGIDVLTGNLMESNGVPGKINVSETLKDFLLQQFRNRFIFKPHKSVRVIYKDVKSYIITDKKEVDTPNNFNLINNKNYIFNRKSRKRSIVLSAISESDHLSTLPKSSRHIKYFGNSKSTNKDTSCKNSKDTSSIS
ncbi:guanylate cyclase, other [Plasmodium vinckei petteri]|uniref:guanylate cyclase n=1 Tax=Plasmodium vinckei petteri TaxID=138298 RepID=W7AHY0_PLAVN|nr:guanylate cyclase, other [Plasmodium vinckei petteri]CAD2104879.1 guanylyl cyclase, putative [Plasmodium vinckei petteri]